MMTAKNKRLARKLSFLLRGMLVLSWGIPAGLISGHSTAHAAGTAEYYVNSFDPDAFAGNWGLWCGEGSVETQQLVDGYAGKAMKITYSRSVAGWGLVAHAGIPAGWDLTGTKSIDFMIKGDSVRKKLSVGIEAPGNKYRKIITITGQDWIPITIPVGELEQAEGKDPLDWSKINGINISPEENGAGSYIIDEFKFDKRDLSLVNSFDPDAFAGNWGLWCGDGSIETQQLAPGYTGNGMKIIYNRSSSGWGLVAHANIPAGWKLAGTKSLDFMIKGDGNAKTLSVGIESPGNKYRKIIKIAGSGWTPISIPVSGLEQPEGKDPLDWSKINGINISPEENGAGSYTIDDFTFNKRDLNLVNSFEPDAFAGNWGLWCGDGSSEKQEIVPGLTGGAMKITYDRSAAGWGLVAHAGLPKDWDLTGTRAIVFTIKGDGTQKRLSVGIEAPGNKYRKIIVINGNTWHRVAIPLNELEQSEGNAPLDWKAINSINISPEENGSGSYTIDEFTFYKGGALPPETSAYATPVILQSFNHDDTSNWSIYADAGNGAKMKASVEDQGVSGKAIRFDYAMSGWGAVAVRSTGANSDWTKFTGISFWAKGEAGRQFRFKLEEDAAHVDEWVKTITLTSNDWEHVIINFTDSFEKSNAWKNDPNQDDTVDLGNIVNYGFIPVGAAGSSGAFSIDEVVLTSPAGGCVISDLRTITLGSVYETNKITVNLDITNFGDKTEEKTIGYTIKDINGIVVTEGKQPSSAIRGNLNATDSISFNVQKYGYYTVEAYFLNDNGDKESLIKKAFAYIDPCQGNQHIKNSNTAMGLASHYDWYGFDNKLMNDEAKMLQSAGMNIERQDFLWKVIEPVKGLFDWSDYDNVVKANYGHGVETLAILAYTSVWASSAPDGAEDKDFYPPRSVDDYANFVFKVVSRYKDKINTWEIWNEPNIDGFFRPTNNADAYFELLRAGYLAAKRADPEAKVIMAGLSGTGGGYLDRLLALGAADYTDAIAFHPYQAGDPGAGDCFVNDIKSVKAKVPHKEIWLTEWGWKSEEQGLANQAIYLVKSILLARTMDVRKISAYAFNSGSDTSYGIVNTSIGGDVKPAYPAINAMNKIMEDRDYKGSVDFGAGVKSHVFTKSGKEPMLVLWSEADKTIEIASGAKAVMYDMYGNAQQLTPVNGKLAVKVTNQPSYVRGSFASLADKAVPAAKKTVAAKPAPRKSWQLQNPYYLLKSMAVTRGFTGSLEVEVYNYQPVTISGALTIGGLPPDWFSQAKERTKLYKVGPYASQIISFKLNPPAKTPLGTYKATVTDTSPARSITAKEYHIEICSTLGLSVGKKAVTLTNHIDKTVGGSIEFDAMDGWAVQVPQNTFDVQPGKSVLMAYNLIPGEKAAANGVMTVSGKIRARSEVIPFAQKLFATMAKQTASPIKIDGVKDSVWDGAVPVELNDISQVSGDFKLDWHKLDDLSAKVYTRWDQENLYVLAEVKDNVHRQTQTGGGMWQGDSIQLAFDAANNGLKGYGQNVYELQIGKTKDGDQIFKGMGFVSGGVMKTGEIAIIRDEASKTTVYEMRIPFRELEGVTDVAAGKGIGYSILVNDNDGGARRGYMEWSSGIGASKDAALFGTLWLN